MARANGTVLEIAVYAGSALMLAGRFRFATEDADIAALPDPWPVWLYDVVAASRGRTTGIPAG
ncbi:MAG: hypothetical protein ACK5YI_13860 [Rhodospirillales bacterium]